MATVLAFDVNETLLDLQALDPLFDDVLGDAALRPQWFATMLQLSFVGGLTGQYVDFSTAQRAALQDDGRTRAQRPLHRGDRDRGRCDAAVTCAPEVRTGADPAARQRVPVDRLDQLGARRRPGSAGQRRPGRAVRGDLFRRRGGALKPFAAPYRMVAERCGVDIGDVCLVAAHAWDVSGALAAGAQAAFVALVAWSRARWAPNPP